MIKPLGWLLVVVVIVALLLGWRNEREKNRRDTHDVVGDSLGRDTRDAEIALRDADTVWMPAVHHYYAARPRVDTVPLPPEVREVIRSCDAAVSACAVRAERSDSLVAALRRELSHAQNPPAGARLSWTIRGGRDLTAKQWEGALGPRYRIAGPVDAYVEGGVRPFQDSLGTWKTEGRLSAGVELNFGGRP